MVEGFFQRQHLCHTHKYTHCFSGACFHNFFSLRSPLRCVILVLYSCNCCYHNTALLFPTSVGSNSSVQQLNMPQPFAVTISSLFKRSSFSTTALMLLVRFSLFTPLHRKRSSGNLLLFPAQLAYDLNTCRQAFALLLIAVDFTGRSLHI